MHTKGKFLDELTALTERHGLVITGRDDGLRVRRLTTRGRYVEHRDGFVDYANWSWWGERVQSIGAEIRACRDRLREIDETGYRGLIPDPHCTAADLRAARRECFRRIRLEREDLAEAERVYRLARRPGT